MLKIGTKVKLLTENFYGKEGIIINSYPVGTFEQPVYVIKFDCSLILNTWLATESELEIME